MRLRSGLSDDETCRMRALIVGVCVAGAGVAHADEIDLRGQAYVDVVETSDGSSWVGAVVEEVPGDHIKLVMADGSVRVIKAADVVRVTKRPNASHASAMPAAMPAAAAPFALLTCAPIAGQSVAAAAPMPIRDSDFVHNGLQVSAAIDMIFPVDDISSFQTSYAPEIRAGYEKRYDRVGVSGGGLVRIAWWQLPPLEDPNDAAWTLETHAYAQAAYHTDRAAVLAGTSLGLDTNYVNINIGGIATPKTTAGFGMNLMAGLELDYVPSVSLVFMFDYHPPTDTIVAGSSTSISYLAATAGAIVHL